MLTLSVWLWLDSVFSDVPEEVPDDEYTPVIAFSVRCVVPVSVAVDVMVTATVWLVSSCRTDDVVVLVDVVVVVPSSLFPEPDDVPVVEDVSCKVTVCDR